MERENAAPSGAAYVVRVRHPVVAQDLTETILEVDPGAEVLHAAHCAEVFELIQGRTAVAFAFVEADPADAAVARLDHELRHRGGRMVLLGDAAEEAWERAATPLGRNWPVLRRPFSSRVVSDLILSARSQRTS